MIRTKFLIDAIPSSWIFEHYCKLNYKLTGQTERIKSIFSSSDTDPSLLIYVNKENNQYNFNDFSAGFSGDGILLVQKIYNISYIEAINKIASDYKSDLNYELEKIIPVKHLITNFEIRNWTNIDAKFWTQFGIGSKLLEKYNIKPLKFYESTQIKDSEIIKQYKVEGFYLYGYFKKNGELAKIYQPKRKIKFLTIDSVYIQGSEQLQYNNDLLVICSSMKDCLSLLSLNFKLETVAPSSENTMLPSSFIAACNIKYKKIITIFDNDEAGKKSMSKYKERYNIPGVYLNLSKDLSDSVRDFGKLKTRNCLIPLIQNT